LLTWCDTCKTSGMRSSLRIAGLLLLTLGAACASSSEEPSQGAEAEVNATAPSNRVEIVVTQAAFLADFRDTFEQIAQQDTRESRHGASSREELEDGILKVSRNDGTIECTEKQCKFSLKPAEMKNGVPLLKGNDNSLAGQLQGSFSHALGTIDGKKPAKFTIPTKPKDKLFIECSEGPSDRGLPTGVCLFQLSK
jgi:hypothetical protein